MKNKINSNDVIKANIQVHSKLVKKGEYQKSPHFKLENVARVKSILEKLRIYVETDELTIDNIPFDVKKLLVTLKKWQLGSDERMYITKNGEAIIKLKFTSGDVQVGVFTAEDDYPNIKLNARTSKYLLDYPDIDKIPFNTLIKLTNDNIVDKSFIKDSGFMVNKITDYQVGKKTSCKVELVRVGESISIIP
jgi:hypothetical protein